MKISNQKGSVSALGFTHDGYEIPKAPPKDPDDIMSWGCDWSENLLQGEVISSSTWIITPNGLTNLDSDLDSSNPNITTAILLGDGELGVTYVLTNRIVSNYRTEDRSMFIVCKTK